MSSLTLAVVVTLLLLKFPYKVNANEQQDPCSRKCGVHTISHPFHLENNSPPECGDQRYTLSCENNQLILYYRKLSNTRIWVFDKVRKKKAVKYYVQSINYNNFTIRLLDFNLARSNNSQLPPYYSLGLYNFSSFFTSSYQWYQNNINISLGKILPKSMLHVSCSNKVEHWSGYMYGCNCMNGTYENSFYVDADGYKTLWELGLGDGCRIESMYLASWPLEHGGRHGGNNVSCSDIRHKVFYGFELFWINSLCANEWQGQDDYGRCKYSSDFESFFTWATGSILLYVGSIGVLFILKYVIGIPCIIVLLIYKLRRKHLSMYDSIEDFLQSDNSIMPIRYSYKDIKRITKQFKIKLGNGGYGSVFKGQLRSGRLVAVKLLDNVKSIGQDFINEVAIIGRIHHVNVVQLIGFCVEGSKRVLIYEFMPNRSLEKYIFSPADESCSLSCEKLYIMSLGVARGIEYLHNGCDMIILHFDIKPHNILLDENFNPKVSDFGLARLYPIDKSIVSLTAARGTIGYMAPELFYRNVGTVSYKADVYSFGMLLMEMASRRKNLNALTEQFSQLYFPFWVYDQLLDGREITIENDTNQEMKLAKRMMIVALWCMQTKPSDRPPMDKVIVMLEEEDEDLQMPNKPYLFAQDLPAKDARDDSAGDSRSSINN